MSLFRISALLVLLGAIACSPTALNQSSASPETADSSEQVAQSSATEPVQAQNVISTEPLVPSPIQIDLDALPDPFDSQSVSRSPNVVAIPENPTLQVPEGFVINVFAEGLERPRWLALTPSGDVLVTETPRNQIRLLRDANGDGAADINQEFAGPDNGLNLPLGMAFADGYFFLGNTNEVRRYSYSDGQEQLTGTGEKIADLPGEGYNQHWTRNVVVSPDEQKLYVSVGSASNVDREPLPRASVQMMNLDGSEQQTFAYGLRNPVGLDFHPVTGELYTTVNERDGLGDDLVPDYFTRLQQGDFYGWPYAYLAPDRLDPRQAPGGNSRNPELAAQTKTPDVLFQAHSAALGVQFYDGTTFPDRYQNGAFAAFRGSWNRNEGTGYKIVFIPFNQNNRPEGYYEDFVTGFLTDPSGPVTWGRPVGMLTLPDGSLLFTEEANGRIYRVQYRGGNG